MNIPKMVMILGVIIFVIGFAMKYISLGRLPGDIFLKGEYDVLLSHRYINHRQCCIVRDFLFDRPF
nr:DUF2905 family protein [Peribacillus frigoritolerans]